MLESDYLKASNLARIRVAMSAMEQVTVSEESGVGSLEKSSIFALLNELMDKLFGLIEIHESNGE